MSEKEKTKKKTEKFDIKSIYTPLSVAKKEIWKRWNDKDLRKKVKDYLGGSMPDPFKKEPRAVLSRSIITPNQELFYFLDLAESTGLKPIGLEGVEDKFCTKNYDKVSLGKLSFFSNKEVKNNIKNIECKKTVINVIDMMASDGKRLCDINTLWGEDLAGFHHRMLDSYNAKIETFDDFKWFSKRDKRNSPYQYYENFFPLFLCHGILFENFHAKGKEEEFTHNIIIKNYKKIEATFGCKPLIVPLTPIEDESELYWWCYPAKIEKTAKERMGRKKSI